MSVDNSASTVGDTLVAPSASHRLAISREQLRQALQQHATVPGRSKTPGSLPGSGGISALLPGLEALRQLWAGHPLRSVLHLANEAADAAVHPFAQRHPLRLLLVAGAAGAFLAWSRPWRWILTPAIVAGLLPRVMRGALGHIPNSVWMGLLSAITRRPVKNGATAPGPGVVQRTRPRGLS